MPHPRSGNRKQEVDQLHAISACVSYRGGRVGGGGGGGGGDAGLPGEYSGLWGLWRGRAGESTAAPTSPPRIFHVLPRSAGGSAER